MRLICRTSLIYIFGLFSICQEKNAYIRSYISREQVLCGWSARGALQETQIVLFQTADIVKGERSKISPN